MDTTAGGDGIAGKFTSVSTGHYVLARSGVDDKMVAIVVESSTREAREASVFASTSPTIHGMRYRRDTTTDGIQLWQNGSFVAQGSTVGTTSYNPGNEFRIGTTTGSPFSSLDGTIAELIVIQSAVTDTEMADLDTYLRNKWAVY